MPAGDEGDVVEYLVQRPGKGTQTLIAVEGAGRIGQLGRRDELEVGMAQLVKRGTGLRGAREQVGDIAPIEELVDAAHDLHVLL